MGARRVAVIGACVAGLAAALRIHEREPDAEVVVLEAAARAGGTVATEAGVAALAAETRKRTDALHILVNNAGANWGGPFETFPWKAWDRVLSVGEQQRLAFCRLLLHKPDWVFMDEATSALDEEMQKSVMALFDKELAGATIVSIAHRPGMEAYHSRTMKLVMAAEGARLVTKRSSRPPPRRTKVKRRRRQPLSAMMWRSFRSAR